MCRHDYVRHGNWLLHEDHKDSSVSVTQIKAAYSEAFEVVSGYVVKEVMLRGKVVCMSMLHDVYQD